MVYPVDLINLYIFRRLLQIVECAKHALLEKVGN